MFSALGDLSAALPFLLDEKKQLSSSGGKLLLRLREKKIRI